MNVKLKIINRNTQSLEGTINSITITPSGNNNSSFKNGSYINSNINNYNNNQNVFLLGNSKLGNNATLSSIYNGYISSNFSDDNGSFGNNPIIITLTGSSIGFININFDLFGGYATKGTITSYINDVIEEKEFTNSNVKTLDVLPSAQSTKIVIKITDWSIPNTQARITSILNTSNISISNMKGLTSMVRGSQCYDDNSKPKFNIIGNYGSSKFYDYKKTIQNMIRNEYFDGSQVEFYVNNEKVGEYNVKDIDKNGTQLYLENESVLIKLDEIKLPKTQLTKYTNYFSLISNLITPLGVKINFTEDFVNLLKNKSFENKSFLKEMTLRELLEMLPVSLNRVIFVDEEGALRDLPKTYNKVLKIKPNNILGDIKQGLNKSNTILNPSIEYNYGYITENEEITNSIILYTNDSNISDEHLLFYKPLRTGKDTMEFDRFTIEEDLDIHYYYNLETSNDFEVLYKTKTEIDYLLELVNNSGKLYKDYMYFKLRISQDDKYFLNKDIETIKMTYDEKIYSRGYNEGTTYWKEQNEISENNGIEVVLNRSSSLSNEYVVEHNIQNYENYFDIKYENGDIILYCVISNFNRVYRSIGVVSLYEFVQTVNDNYSFHIETTLNKSSGKGELKYNENKPSDFIIQSNDLVTFEVGKEIVNEIYNKYNRGLSSISITVLDDNYYDTNGNLVYSKGQGNKLKVGDIVELYEKVGGIDTPITDFKGENKKFQITSNEIDYNGRIKHHLELLEYKE